MTKQPNRASEILKERKYPTDKVVAGLTPIDRAKLKRRLLAYVPSVLLYFALRELLAMDIIPALVLSSILSIATYLLLAPVKPKQPEQDDDAAA